MNLVAKRGPSGGVVHIYNMERGRTLCGQKVNLDGAWSPRSGEPDCPLCVQLLQQEAQPEATVSQGAAEEKARPRSTRREYVEQVAHEQIWALANDHQTVEGAVRDAREIMYVVRGATDLTAGAREIIEIWLDRYGRTPLKETPPGDSRDD